MNASWPYLELVPLVVVNGERDKIVAGAIEGNDRKLGLLEGQQKTISLILGELNGRDRLDVSE